MGACETTPPASTSRGNQPSRPFRHPQIPEGSSSLPIIGRRLPASSSFVLAATQLRALQLDPGPRDSTNLQRREKPAQQSPQARRPDRHRSPGQTTAPLDSKGPHGCKNAGTDTRQMGAPCPLGSFSGLSYEPRAVPPPESAAGLVPGHGTGPGRPWTILNRSTYAAGACTLPFRAAGIVCGSPDTRPSFAACRPGAGMAA